MDLPPEVVLDQEDDAETDESESRNPRAVTTRMPSWRGVAHAVILVRLGPAPSLRREELSEQRFDVVAQQRVEAPPRTVIRPPRVEQLRVGPHRSGLFVGGAEDHERDASEDGRAGAHSARLDSHVERAVRESPAAERARCIANRDHLRVRGRIGISLSSVAGAGDDGAVAYDRGTDRHVAVLPRTTPLLQCITHEAVVVRRPWDGVGIGEWQPAVRPLLHTPRYRVSTSRCAASSAGVPAKTIVPLFMTRTRCPTLVARPRFCSTRRRASPVARSPSRISPTCSTSFGASPSEGSSRSRTVGFRTSARAIASICGSPPDNWSPRTARRRARI